MNKKAIARLVLIVLDVIFITLLTTYYIYCAATQISPKLWIIIVSSLDLVPQYLYYSFIKYFNAMKEGSIQYEKD